MKNSSFPISFEQLMALTGPDHIKKPYAGNVEKTLQWHESAQSLIEKAIASGVVDFQAPARPDGSGALVAWDCAFEEGLPFELLKMSAVMDPKMGPAVEGVPALAQALDHVLSSTSRKSAMDRILSWVKAASPEAIFALDGPSQKPGDGLLRWLSSQKSTVTGSATRQQWEGIVDAAVDKGAHWISPSPESLGSPSLPPNLLDALCERGLGLFEGPENQQIWKVIVDLGQPLLTNLVSSRIESRNVAGAPTEGARFETLKAKFFSGFHGLNSHGAGRRQAGKAEEDRQKVSDYLTSRSDWADLADQSGRSAFFHAVLVNPGIVRNALAKIESESTPEAEKSSWRRALRHRDNKGRNIWFYLLPHSADATMTDNLVSALASVVQSSDDSSGNPWAVQLLTDVGSSLAAFTLPGSQHPPTRLPDIRFKSARADRVVYGDAWSSASNEARERAVAGACRSLFASSWVMKLLPDTPQTLPAKALLKVLSESKSLASSGAHGKMYREMLSEATGEIKATPESFLPVSENLMAKFRKRVEKNLSESSPSGAGFVLECFEVLEQIALRTRLESGLRASEAAPRRPRF